VLSWAATHGYRGNENPARWEGNLKNLLAQESKSVVEMALAHVISDKVERAYRRGELLGKRRALMQAWAAFIGPAPIRRLHATGQSSGIARQG
jgi:hypothetical protein